MCKEFTTLIGLLQVVYISAFWFTYLCSLIYFVHLTKTGEVIYNLLIVAVCTFACQGLILTLVYFGLEKISTPKEVTNLQNNLSIVQARGPTVKDIRANVQAKEVEEDGGDGTRMRSSRRMRRSSTFSIFDGKPDEDSPWAQFLQDDYYSDDNEVYGNEPETT